MNHNHAPHPVRSWFVSPRAKSVAFVVAALCLAFTEGQAPPAPRTGATGDAPAAALDLAGMHAGQVAALDRAKSILATIEAQETCARCKDWEVGADWEHYATFNFPVLEGWHGNEDEEGADPDGTHFDVLSGSCEENHDTCTGGEQLFASAMTEETIDAVARRDVGLLAQLMTSSRVYLVPERIAVQILGCGSTIAAHLPIDRRLLSAVEAVVAEQDLF
jgi:hypothetical protein